MNRMKKTRTIRLLVLIWLLICASCTTTTENCSELTSFPDHCANKPTENVLNYLVQCINETTVSVSWGPIDEEQNINLINLEYSCYDRDNNTQIHTTVFKYETDALKSYTVLSDNLFSQASCVFNGCFLPKGRLKCWRFIETSLDHEVYCADSIKPLNSSIFSTPTNNMYSSIFLMPTETTSLSINTIQTESHTSTPISSPPIPVLILNTSSLHQSTFSVNDIKPSSTSEPTNINQNSAFGNSPVVLSSVVVSLIILALASSTALFLSCMAYKKHTKCLSKNNSKDNSKDLWYPYKEKELRSLQHNFNMNLKELSIHGSVITIIQPLQYHKETSTSPKESLSDFSECSTTEECSEPLIIEHTKEEILDQNTLLSTVPTTIHLSLCHLDNADHSLSKQISHTTECIASAVTSSHSYKDIHLVHQSATHLTMLTPTCNTSNQLPTQNITQTLYTTNSIPKQSLFSTSSSTDVSILMSNDREFNGDLSDDYITNFDTLTDKIVITSSKYEDTSCDSGLSFEHYLPTYDITFTTKSNFIPCLDQENIKLQDNSMSSIKGYDSSVDYVHDNTY